MKIIDSMMTMFSYKVRSYWNIVQDLICLGVCVLASSSAFPYYERANNLFIFFTGITLAVFLYKVFKNESYKESVRVFGAWGAKYRCFYAIYYSTIAYLCASQGGLKGYSFAFIWILSGGSYLTVANKIFNKERESKQENAKKIEEKHMSAEDRCPYCKSNRYKNEAPIISRDSLRIKNTCKSKDCNKSWIEVYNKVDLELNEKDIPINMVMASKVFE